MNKKKSHDKKELLVSRGPHRYRLRAKLLFQQGGLPRNVRRYLMSRFPCMCGLKYKAEVAHV